MKHRDRVIKALQFEATDRVPFQATFCPEFANRLREEFGITDTHFHDPHSGRWNGYDLEILTGQDALQCGIGWFINYYLDDKPYTDEWGVDMIWLGDDIGVQDALLISPEMWREFLKPRMIEGIHTIRNVNPNIKIAYHTDGNNYEILPELIEIGVDVLNPVLTESMDPVLLKEKYGTELCFFGAISVQSTLPFGTPEDVIKEFRKRKSTTGKNGGWICAPAHHIQQDTPMKNFFALLDEIGTEYRSSGISGIP